jgi:hypothetical protein
VARRVNVEVKINVSDIFSVSIIRVDVVTSHMPLISVSQFGALFLLLNYVSRTAEANCVVTRPTLSYHSVACYGHIDPDDGDWRFLKRRVLTLTRPMTLQGSREKTDFVLIGIF